MSTTNSEPQSTEAEAETKTEIECETESRTETECEWETESELESPREPCLRNWLELPRDLTASILLRLGAIEILDSAQKVCTLWRSITKEPSMWRVIDMRIPGDLRHMPCSLEEMCMRAIDRSAGGLVDISIEYFGTDELLDYITQRFFILPAWVARRMLVLAVKKTW